MSDVACMAMGFLQLKIHIPVVFWKVCGTHLAEQCFYVFIHLLRIPSSSVMPALIIGAAENTVGTCTVLY